MLKVRKVLKVQLEQQALKVHKQPGNVAWGIWDERCEQVANKQHSHIQAMESGVRMRASVSMAPRLRAGSWLRRASAAGRTSSASARSLRMAWGVPREASGLTPSGESTSKR